MPAALVVTKLNPRETSSWLPPFGLHTVASLDTQPFLALYLFPGDYRIFGDKWGYFNTGKLFVLSRERPKGIYQGLYCTFIPTGPGKVNISRVRALPLDDDEVFIHIHTLPALIDALHTDESMLPSLESQIDDKSLEIFCRAVLEDVDRLHQRIKDVSQRHSGGVEPVQEDWDTWSTLTRWDNRFRPRRGPCVFEFLSTTTADDWGKPPSVFRELRLLRQLEKDYRFRGVFLVYDWVIELRNSVSCGESVPPIPPFACEVTTGYREMPSIDNIVRLVVEDLYSTPIPYDGEPERSDGDDKPIWHDDPSPRLEVAPRLDLPLPIPPTTVGMIVFDIIDTLIDRDTAIYDAIKTLSTAVPMLSERHQVLSLFKKREAIRTRASPSARPVEHARDAVLDVALHLGLSTSKDDLECAMATLQTPLIHLDAIPFLNTLQPGDFVTALPLLETTFSRVPDLPSSAVRWLPVPAARFYSQTTHSLMAMFEFARRLYPDIEPARILIVSSSIYRTIEPANDLGFQTAHIARPWSHCSCPRLELTGSTYVTSDLLALTRCISRQQAFVRDYPRDPNFWTPYRIQRMWQCNRELGAGGFGTTYNAFNLYTNEEVAIKIDVPDEELGLPCALPYEVKIYKALEGYCGIPGIRWHGEEGNAALMVMDKLGPTLEQLRKFCRGRFSLKTICMLALQLISRIEFIHSRGILVRDIKPENLAMGRDDNRSVLYIFDFGISKLYVNPKTGEHIPFREGRDDVGTPRYVSYNAHFGRELSRRDDIESLGTVLLLLWHNRLAWQGIYAPSIKDKKRRMGEMKAGEPMQELLSRSPPEFTALFKHSRSLAFEDRPDYELIRQLFLQRMQREGWENDGIFDWIDGRHLEKGTIMPHEYVWVEEDACDASRELMVTCGR